MSIEKDLAADRRDNCTFFLYERPKDYSVLEISRSKWNNIVFIQKGELLVSCNNFIDRPIKSGECFSVPRSSYVRIIYKADTTLLVCSYNMPVNLTYHNIADDYYARSRELNYNFTGTSIKPPLDRFVDQIIGYIRAGVMLSYMNVLKHYELSILLKHYYSRDELVRLLHPLFGQSMQFKDLVLLNYSNVENVEQLAEICNMNRRTFDRKFNEIFNMPPQKWMNNQKAINIKQYLSDPNATIASAMIHFHFNYWASFNRYCKQYLGSAPSEIIKKSQNRK